ncbi:MAG: hypothetical protein GY826_39920, partial [Fuerstiella sp.]|nr:hypothetical protein [Fuerstiella sp.]
WKRDQATRLLFAIPLLSIAAALPGMVQGSRARGVAPTTLIESRVVIAADGQAAVAADGISTFYSPAIQTTVIAMSRFTTLRTEQGSGQRLVWTDGGDSYWSGFSQPAGASSYPERSVVTLDEPLKASGWLDEGGLHLSLANSDSLNPQDILLASISPDRMAFRSEQDGFVTTTADVLATEEFSKETLLTQSQILHADLYRTVFENEERLTRFPAEPSVLFWTDRIQPGITIDTDSVRMESSTLFCIPLSLGRPAIGASVSIPPTLLPYRGIRDVDGAVGSAFSARQG